MNRKKIEQSINRANESEIKKYKVYNVADKFLSSKLNDDVLSHIKVLLAKKDNVYSYDDIKKTIADLIISFYNKLNDAIYNDIYEYNIKYSNKKFIDDRDARLLYNIIIIIYNEYPNKLFTIKKFKFSKVNKYFIYEIYVKNTKKIKYLLFDYSETMSPERFFFIYVNDDIEELKERIKYFFHLSRLSFSKSKSKSK